MRKINLLILTTITSLLSLTSCQNDDNSIAENNSNEYTNGVFILNEGRMGSDNAEVTFFRNGETKSQIFRTANPSLNLGNVATHLHFKENDAYLVVNLSNKIEVVDAKTFQSKGTITSNLNNPRYVETDQDKIYVTNWGDPSNPTDDFVAIYRRSDLAFIQKIDVKEGPEHILLKNQKLFINHSGGWNYGNSVSIYNLSTNQLSNIEIGDVPSAIAEDNNNVYILCTGIEYGENISAGKIVEINANTNETETLLQFNQGENPRFLIQHNNNLFFTLNNRISKINIDNETKIKTDLFTVNTQFMYSFNIVNNAFFIGDAKDFISNGEVKYYSLTGDLLGNISTGIGPNYITFY